jgi:hypothetical protein
MMRASIGEELQQQLLRLLQKLGLRMGVFDLNIDPSGEAVWLELIPKDNLSSSSPWRE